MKPIKIGLAAALAVGVLVPSAVLSQSKDAGVTQKAREQGMAEAPALAQAAGVTCQIADARFIGKGENKKEKTTTSVYEVDCDQGLGFVIQAVSGQTPQAFDCLAASAPTEDGKPSSIACQLPGNANAENDVAQLAQKGGVSCPVQKVRSIGQSPSNTFYEVLCEGGSGYVVQAGAPPLMSSEIKATDCLMYDQAETNIKCELASPAERLALVDRLAAQGSADCVVKDRKYIATTTEGARFFEASCQDGKGYMYKVAANGQLDQTLECAKALAYFGGCTLTDSREAQTAQAELYTQLARSAGFNCDVSEYAIFPAQQGQDVVELVCKNGPGGVGIFDVSGKGQVYNCAHALIAGYRCGLNPANASNGVLTADLKKLGKDTCTVKDSRMVGKTASGAGYIEVSCSDGLAGYMIEYTSNPVAPKEAIGCAFAKGVAGGCKLEGNT